MPRPCARPVLLTTALVALSTTACGDGSTEPAPTPNRAPLPSGSIPAQTVGVAETATLNLAGYFTDPDGDALTYGAASSDVTIASVAVSGSVLTISGVASGAAAVTVTATDGGGLSAQQSFAVTVPNRAPEAVGEMGDLEIAVDSMAELDVAAYFADPDGDDLEFEAVSSDTTRVRVTVSGSVLTITGVASGAAAVTVTATDGGRLSAQQSFAVTVPNRAPEATDTIPPQVLTVGETRSWAGSEYFSDPDGDPLILTAGTTDTSVVQAAVSGDQFEILAVAPGAATVTFTATDPGGLGASQSFDVTSERPRSLGITNVAPATLLEGAQATISGFGFSSVAADNEVLIGGVAATVTASSATRLSVTVPVSDCLPPRRAELRVTVQDDSDARLVGVSPRSREDIDLPVGWYRYTHAGNGCLHLPGDDAGGAYVIGVVSISEEPSSLTPVAATSIVGDPSVVAERSLFAYSAPVREAVAPAPRIPSTRAAAAAPAGAATPLPQEIIGGPRGWERPHNEVMNRNREIVQRLGRVDPATAHARATLAPSVSDTLTLFAAGESCSARDELRAVVRRIGDHTVWLDDVENPSGTFTDSELAELDAFYGARVKGVHDDYFGGVSDVDGNGRVMVVMTKEVNQQDDPDSFLGGWVWFRDLYPSEACATSNEAEILFGRAPDPDGVFGQAWTRERTLEYYPSLLTHEITHLAQGAALVFGGADFATWELEGGATLAEQLVAYGLFGHGSGRNMGYEQWNEGRAWYEQLGFRAGQVLRVGRQRRARHAPDPERAGGVQLDRQSGGGKRRPLCQPPQGRVRCSIDGAPVRDGPLGRRIPGRRKGPDESPHAVSDKGVGVPGGSQRLAGGTGAGGLLHVAVDRPERLGRVRHEDLGSRRHLEPLRADPTSSAPRIDIRGIHRPVEYPSRIHVIPGVESGWFAGADVHPGDVRERRSRPGPHIGMGLQGPMTSGTASRCES